MYTLDANIFVRDASPSDPEHATCHALMAQLYQRNTAIIVPYLVLAEIAGALSRSFRDPIRARLEVELLRDLHHIQFVPLDATVTQDAAEIAADRALRGADAVYVAVARRYGCALVTLDREPRERAASVVRTLTPAEALAELGNVERKT
ncbi:type II toxin-antitoxin system VapC family toxin [Candidatus Viridilinea mediisalina]|uniref:Ribonuclease VapC n=1 Tax=Candidatus Viridilinea mediisalina TaxID=2024553 RepID=A0A2A6RPS7_9CHLR|nr:type II toxin-antitoxin system VapC family toxin [Candidatus Viridilinea mediisalina]PDW05124.1 VapC toxin family PIN domain ribonuclease [Candidatus Viridilinea mediisalina]